MDVGDLIRSKREELRMSQRDLAERVGIKQQSLEAIEAGRTQKSRYLPKIASVLDIPLSDLDPTLPVATPTATTANSGMLINEKFLLGERDFPVYASAEGGPGEIIRSIEAVDWVPRPSIVQHVRDAYGLIVTGDSMQPEFEPGDTAIVNPRAPTFGGTTCVFYSEREGEARATVKRLLRTSGDKWFLRQWNPPHGMKGDFTLPRKEWAVCHRILGKYYRQ